MTLSNSVKDQVEKSAEFFLTGFLEDFDFNSKEEFEEIRLALIESVADKLHSEVYKLYFFEDEE